MTNLVKQILAGAPAYPLNSPNDYDALQHNINWLKQNNLAHISTSPLIINGPEYRYWPHLEQRGQEFYEANNFDYYWPVRGGYGNLECLRNPSLLTQIPGVIGFSDNTVLHVANHIQSISGFYGPHLASNWSDRQKQEITDFLHNKSWRITKQDVATIKFVELAVEEIENKRNISGSSFAACLRVLASVCGTNLQPRFNKHILFLEDIDEAPYAVSRDLEQLYHAGCFDNLGAIVFGEFPISDPFQRQGGPSIQEVLSNFAHLTKLPCFYGLPFGHSKNAYGIPQQWHCTISYNYSAWQIDFTAKQ